MRHNRPQPGDRRTNVLVVEKEPIVTCVLARGLSNHGFEVLTADTGDTAQKLFHTYASRLCLVVVDIDRELTGIEFVQSRPDLTPHIPILFITALGDIHVEDLVPND